MPAISRKVGSTSQYLPVFIPDATVSTGAGLANIVVSTMSLAWYRNDMSAVSTQTCSSGTFGTWASSTVNQALSTLALGWYGVSLPNGMFASGSAAFAHLSGAANMAPVPILVELTAAGWDNQVAISTQAATMPVVNTDKAGYGVSNINIPVGVSSFGIAVGVSSVADKAGYGVSNINIPVGVSAFGIAVGVSSVGDKSGYGVSSLALYGSVALTTGAGIISAGNAFLDVSVSSRLAAAGYTAPDNTGIAFVSSTAQTLTSGERNSIADALLNRNVSGGSSAGRLVKQAYHVLRNKVDTGAGIVYDVDDITSSWAFTVSTVAGNPIVAVLPA